MARIALTLGTAEWAWHSRTTLVGFGADLVALAPDRLTYVGSLDELPHRAAIGGGHEGPTLLAVRCDPYSDTAPVDVVLVAPGHGPDDSAGSTVTVQAIGLGARSRRTRCSSTSTGSS